MRIITDILTEDEVSDDQALVKIRFEAVNERSFSGTSIAYIIMERNDKIASVAEYYDAVTLLHSTGNSEIAVPV